MPLGLPGVWIMVVLLLGAVLGGWISWATWTALLGLAAAAELLEFVLLKRLGDRYGASRPAFWAAIAGGFLGLFVGLPVPIVGPMITGLIGTFAGAALVTVLRERSLREAGRVGWGVLLARVLAVGVKAAAGVVLFGVGTAALFLD